MLHWKETTQERFYYMLKCLPPIYGKNADFACSEPLTHNGNGQNVYRIYRMFDGKFYEAVGTRQQMDSATLNQEVIDRCTFIHWTVLDYIESIVTWITDLQPEQIYPTLKATEDKISHNEALDCLYLYCGYDIKRAIDDIRASQAK